MLVGDFDLPVLSQSVTIPLGDASSGSFTLGGTFLVGFVPPTAWTAATLSLQASFDAGATWLDVASNTGGILTLSSNAGIPTSLYFIPGSFGGAVTGVPVPAPLFRLRSQTAGVDVVQAAARTFTLLSLPSVFRRP